MEVIVVGAGAAGQTAAIAAAEAGRHVVLVERKTQPGLKLLASGGGRANLTNLAPRADFVSAFGRQGRFMLPALEAMGPDALRDFFARLGLPTATEGPRVYPASKRAADAQVALRRRVEQLGVTLRLGRGVSELWIENGRLAGVTIGTERLAADRVILACGGPSWPKLSGTAGGYALAGQAGHTIIEPTPALVPLITHDRWPAKLAGVALEGARVWIAAPKQAKAGITGDVLFTHRGVSGPAILDLSGSVAQLLSRGADAPLRIELIAGMDAAAWRRQFDQWRQSAPRKQVLNLLRATLPTSLCQLLCRHTELPEDTPMAQLPGRKRDALVQSLAALKLTVTDTEGSEAAFVTRGGVKLREVSPDTLESRLLPGLHIVGELLDLDGPTGGYNLQWAFASGHLAGRSAADE